jgi:hypothetical protein
MPDNTVVAHEDRFGNKDTYLVTGGASMPEQLVLAINSASTVLRHEFDGLGSDPHAVDKKLNLQPIAPAVVPPLERVEQVRPEWLWWTLAAAGLVGVFFYLSQRRRKLKRAN